jgi:hypothetical protein
MYFDYSSAQNYVRTLTQGVSLTDSLKLTGEYKRGIEQLVQAKDIPTGLLTLCRNIIEAVKGIDQISFSVFLIRSMKESLTISDYLGQLKSLFRRLIDKAYSIDEVKGGWVINRFIADTAIVAGAVFRGLLIFVKILTTSLVRDFILRQFLVAREELFLKSCITRELTIDSKLN